jgi:putative membrane protein
MGADAKAEADLTADDLTGAGPSASTGVAGLPTADNPAHLPWRAILREATTSILFPFLGIFLVSGPVWWVLLLIFFGLLALRVFFLRFFLWWVTSDSLVIRKGALFRSQRVLPRARIQAVDLEQGPLSRLLGLTEVRVEALGGGETEGRIPGISPVLGERLRTVLLHGDGAVHGNPADGDAVPEIPIPPRIALTEDQILVAGLTENRLGVGIGIVALLSEVVRQLVMNGQVDVLERTLGFLLLLPGLPLLVGVGLIVLAFSVAMSFIFSIQAFWDFTLRWDGDELQVDRGLLYRHRDTVPLSRIQAVQVVENPVRRLLGLATVRVLVGGRAAGGGGATANILLPAGPRADAFALAHEVVGWIPPDPMPPALAPMPRGARERRWFRGFLMALGIGLLVGILNARGGAAWDEVLRSALLSGLVVLPLGILLGEAAWRGLGWGRLGVRHLAFREGVLTRTTTLVPFVRVQSVEITSNPFQRRRGLATLTLPVARPPLGEDPRGLDLSEDEAIALRRRLVR